MLDITLYTGVNIVQDIICDDVNGYHPIYVKLSFADHAPKLSSDNYTLEVKSNVAQNIGITSDVPAYLSQGDVTVAYDDSDPYVYSITGWPSDMAASVAWYLYLPSAKVGGADYTLDATLKYPDSVFSTVDHVFY